MIETARLVVLLFMCSESLIIYGTSDDRDFSKIERETLFVFDIRTVHGVHLITVVHIYYDEGLLL